MQFSEDIFMPVRKLGFLLATILFTLAYPFSGSVWAQEQNAMPPQGTSAPTAEKPQSLAIAQALMCERVDNLVPFNRVVTFPVSVGQVCCFTLIDPVPKGTLIFHRWFHFDELSTQVKLKVYPPRWTTFSTIQLREADKGPWRVEVADQNGQVLTVLRFSITD